MKRAVMLSAVAAALLSIGVGAQGRNFSGTWVIDQEKTTAAGGGATGGRGGGSGEVTRSRVDGSAAGAVAVGGVARGGGGDRAIAAAGVGGVRSAGGGAAAGLSLTMDANSFTIANGATTTTYKLDGSVTNIENPRAKISAKASWQGDRIAIETTSESPNGAIVTHAFWYLEGEYLVRENKSTGPDGQDVIRKTYYKRS